MFKIVLQTTITLLLFLVSFFKERIPKRRVKFYIILILIVLGINFYSIYRDTKNQRHEQNELKEEIDKISRESDTRKNKIDKLLSENSKLRVEVKEQSNKIDSLTQEIIRLAKLLEEMSTGKLAKTASYAEAKNLYNVGMQLMKQGKDREAAKKFLEFREIAIKEHAYEAAAISSLIASFRFKDIGEDVKAAELQSEAGDFFIKLKRYGEAQAWKKNAKQTYETKGFTIEAEAIGKEIERLDLLLR